MELQELGGWQLGKVARDYLADNLTKKVSIARKLQVGEVAASASRSKKIMDQGGFNFCGEATKNVVRKTAAEVPITKDNSSIFFNLENCHTIEVHIHVWQGRI